MNTTKRYYYLLIIVCFIFQPHLLVAQEKVTSNDSAMADLLLVQEAAKARLSEKNPSSITRLISKGALADRSLQWFINEGLTEEALRFVNSMAPFWFMEGRLDAGRKMFDAVLKMPSDSSMSTLRAQAYYEAGLLAFRQRDPQTILYINASLDLARILADTPSIARALTGLSRQELRVGAYDSVRVHSMEAVRLLSLSGNKNATVPIHILAAVNRMTGKDVEANRIYEQTLKEYQSRGDQSGVAMELSNLGYVRLHQNKSKEAAALFRDALTHYKKLHDSTSLTFMLSAFAAIAAVSKQNIQSAKLYGASLNLSKNLGVTLDPDDQYEFDRYSLLVKKRLGIKEFEKQMEEGKNLNLETALKLSEIN